MGSKQISPQKRRHQTSIQPNESVPPPQTDWETVFRSINDPAMILSPDFSIQHANLAAQKAAGLSERELKGRHCYEVFHGTQTCAPNCPLAKLKISKQAETEAMEVELLKRTFRVSCSPILDEKGEIQSIVHIASDITARKQAEDALQESEAHYRAVVEGTPLIVYSFSNQRGGIYYSEHVIDILGYSPEQLCSQPMLWRNSIHTDDLSSWDQRNLVAVAGKTARVEYRIQDARGNWRWFDDRAFKYQMDDGEFVIEGRALDITERKRTELALQIAETNCRLIFENAPIGIFQSTPQGRYHSVNPAMAHIFGYDSPQEMISSITDISRQIYVNPSDRLAFQRCLSEHGQVSEFTGMNRRKDGSQICTQTTARVEKDTQGHILYYEGFITDISGRVQMENELRESEQKYRSLVELSPDMIAIYSKGKIRFTNRAGLRLVGADTLDQLLGKSNLDVIAPRQRADINKRIQRAIRERVALPPLDQKFLRLDGSELEVSVTAVPTTWQGKPAMQFIARDITERKQTERELRYMKAGLEAANRELQTALAREKELSHTDVVTDINNRRYLFELAEHEFQVAARYNQPLSVMMFDIDHFKLVNDTFGHAVGDQLLQRVTQIASAKLRSADVIGRYGGEEFIILLPMTNARQAHSLAERIRADVADLRLPTPKGDATVTLSIGIVEMLHLPKTEISGWRGAGGKCVSPRGYGHVCGQTGRAQPHRDF